METKTMSMTFDEWFDTTYGDMFMEGKDVILLLAFKEVSQKAWEAALMNNKPVSVLYELKATH